MKPTQSKETLVNKWNMTKTILNSIQQYQTTRHQTKPFKNAIELSVSEILIQGTSFPGRSCLLASNESSGCDKLFFLAPSSQFQSAASCSPFWILYELYFLQYILFQVGGYHAFHSTEIFESFEMVFFFTNYFVSSNITPVQVSPDSLGEIHLQNQKIERWKTNDGSSEYFYRTRVRSLATLVTNSLTD